MNKKTKATTFVFGGIALVGVLAIAILALNYYL